MGSVSIADMERVALGGDTFRMGGSSDIGATIELSDLNDDLGGISLLMNPNKVSGGSAPAPSSSETRTISFSAPSVPAFGSNNNLSNGGSLGGIDITPLEPAEPISLNIDAAPIDFGSSPPVEIKVNKEPASASSTFGGLFSNSQTATGPGIHLTPALTKSPEQEKQEKSDLLNKLQRLEQKGFPVARKFTMDNSLDEIKTEYMRLVDARQLETSIKFQRQMLMGAITGMEWLNGRFDPFDLKLDGWSENVHENIEDFDEIFEELYDKYKEKGKMSPEMRLIMAVGGSGFMCHVSNTFFRSKMPSMDEVLRRNPDLARQMASAAAQQAGPGFGNFMNMAMGMGAGGGGPGPSGPTGVPTSGFPGNGGPVGPQPSPAQVPATGAFFSASGAPPVAPRPTARREMTGPTGVDDILRQFDEVRRAEANASATTMPTNGFATQPAVAAASGAASVISAEDFMSQAESTRTGATGSGRRRRKTAAPPVGATYELNV